MGALERERLTNKKYHDGALNVRPAVDVQTQVLLSRKSSPEGVGLRIPMVTANQTESEISPPPGGGDGNNLLYLSGVPHNKVASQDIINKVVSLVETKVKETSN